MRRRLLPALVLLVTLCLPGRAQTSPNTPSDHERTLAAESFTTERLSVWQKRLNLQDWKITVCMARTTDLRPKTLGNIHWDLEHKSATIHVLDPADYKMAPKEMYADMEFTVVHELIHLGFAPVLAELQRSDANRREEEYAVNHMARALLELDQSK